MAVGPTLRVGVGVEYGAMGLCWAVVVVYHWSRQQANATHLKFVCISGN